MQIAEGILARAWIFEKGRIAGCVEAGRLESGENLDSKNRHVWLSIGKEKAVAVQAARISSQQGAELAPQTMARQSCFSYARFCWRAGRQVSAMHARRAEAGGSPWPFPVVRSVPVFGGLGHGERTL